ncbi:hypothetical protein sos41_38910 [Alphaproteobacteria bacterium SO-S41]|nr:hypothetical protein sos41_38910 [Alphaproteobacteria bacterium SO-S41]
MQRGEFRHFAPPSDDCLRKAKTIVCLPPQAGGSKVADYFIVGMTKLESASAVPPAGQRWVTVLILV